MKRLVPNDLISKLIKFAKLRIKKRMLANISNTGFLSFAIKNQLKKSVDPILKKSCLEGSFLFYKTNVNNNSELKQFYSKHKHILNGMKGLGSIRKYRNKQHFNTDWQLEGWKKVDKKFEKPRLTKLELCKDTSLTV